MLPGCVGPLRGEAGCVSGRLRPTLRMAFTCLRAARRRPRRTCEAPVPGPGEHGLPERPLAQERAQRHGGQLLRARCGERGWCWPLRSVAVRAARAVRARVAAAVSLPSSGAAGPATPSSSAGSRSSTSAAPVQQSQRRAARRSVRTRCSEPADSAALRAAPCSRPRRCHGQRGTTPAHLAWLQPLPGLAVAGGALA